MYVTLVWGCLLINALGAAYLLVKGMLAPWKKVVFAATALGSLGLKLFLATRGHNYDLDSFGIVASLVLEGKSIYANTSRYNYGPLWAFAVAGLRQLSLRLPAMGGESFHAAVAAFLGVADVALAAILATRFSFGAAIFFLCCPVTLLLSGYHSQFDNLALLAGIASWVLIRTGSASPRRIVLAAALLGASLTLKHVLFLFPIWVLFWPKMGKGRSRFAYPIVAYGIFGLSFLPWMGDPASRAGVIQNVFRYRSEFNLSLGRLIVSVHPFSAVSSTVSVLLTLGWVAAVLALGFIVNRRVGDLFALYLLVMFTFSPALVDQYLSLAALASAMLLTTWPSWALAGTATLALFISPADVFHLPFNIFYYAAMVSTQICAGALLLVELRCGGNSRAAPASANEVVKKSVTLAFSGFALVLLLFLAKMFVAYGTRTAHPR